jgi:hypothetical protein
MSMAASSHFVGNALDWPILRRNRSFRVFVVEPADYASDSHDRVFNAAITSLVSPRTQLVGPHGPPSRSEGPDHFDLITFPEAFLSTTGLLTALASLSASPSLGCVHVGLKADEPPESHLFAVRDVGNLVRSISELQGVVAADLRKFSLWLDEQPADRRFNLGCLFTLDAERRLRVCLHPKIVRSKYEAHALHEGNMWEANLLSIVTLRPTDKSYLSITLQPLLCSDALNLDTDTHRAWPLIGVNEQADCFGDAAPDHVDIVSVPTCTPQQNRPARVDGRIARSWHEAYLDTFTRGPNELPRHFGSVFVMSNFQTLPGGSSSELLRGGLSGVFMPVPPGSRPPPFVTVFSYGRLGNSAVNDWFVADDASGDASPRGFLATLDSEKIEGTGVAFMLGFTIDKLIRDAARWRTHNGLLDFQLRRAHDEAGQIIFGKREFK